MYISLDIGATNTRIAGSQSLENINLENKIAFKTSLDFNVALTNIVGNIKKITDRPQAIGLGIACSISENKKDIIRSTNMLDWVGKPLLDMLAKEFDCLVYIANDSEAQAMAEFYYGTKLHNIFLYLTLGTGLGATLFDGSGQNINYGELSRDFLQKWEDKVGGKNIAKNFHKKPGDLTDDEWEIILDDFRDCIKDLYEIFKVDYIVLAGGIIDRQKQRFEKIKKDIKKPEILFSDLREDSGLYGGLALITNNLKN